MKAKVIAIIPAHNESKHIDGVIEETKKYVDSVVVVDDGSTDDTLRIASKRATTLHHVVNLGKGAALKTGCDYAVSKADVLVLLDSDGQHKPSDIPRFLKSLEGVDIVFGSRSLNKNMPLFLRFGNWFINQTVAVLFGIRLRDTQSGFRAFRSSVYDKIRWTATDYFVESEMLAHVGMHKLHYNEISIDTIYNERYKGTTVLDGIKIVFSMIWWRIAK